MDTKLDEDEIVSITVNGEAIEPQQILHHSLFFFKELNGLLLLLLLFLIGLIIALCILFGLQTRLDPPPTYFTATESIQLIQELPLTEAYLPTNAMLNWVTEAMIEAYTFNFVDYHKALQNSEAYFMPEAYQSYLNAVQNVLIGEIQEVVAKRQVLQAVPSAAPTLLEDGVVEDAALGKLYAWRVRSPITLSFFSADGMRQKNLNLLLTIIRTPLKSSAVGIKIYRFTVDYQNKSIAE